MCGGTLDCWPLFLLVARGKTINVGLNLGTRVKLLPKDSSTIELEMTSLGYAKNFSNLSSLLASPDHALDLIKPVLNYFKPTDGFHLSLESDSPVGGGLGGSSSLLVGLIKTFLKWRGESISDQDLVRLACNLETRVLKKPAGTQDYISALDGGVSVIDYGDDGPRWRRLSRLGEEIGQRFILVDTGKPHHSGLNNWDVLQKALNGDAQVLEALKGLAELSVEFDLSLTDGDWSSLEGLFKREYDLRVRLSKEFTSQEIEKLRDVVGESGTVKICGAGGGGCAMVWTAPSRRLALRDNISAQGFKVLDATSWSREGA